MKLDPRVRNEAVLYWCPLFGPQRSLCYPGSTHPHCIHANNPPISQIEFIGEGTKSFRTAEKKVKHSPLCCSGLRTYRCPDYQSSGLFLIGHVDAEFRWRDKVFPGALCDHHSRLLVEHGCDLWWRFRRGQILSCLGVLATLEVVGHVTIFPQEGEELQQEVAEVLTDAKPPCKKISKGFFYMLKRKSLQILVLRLDHLSGPVTQCVHKYELNLNNQSIVSAQEINISDFSSVMQN